MRFLPYSLNVIECPLLGVYTRFNEKSPMTASAAKQPFALNKKAALKAAF
jgi:hypothetical protein